MAPNGHKATKERDTRQSQDDRKGSKHVEGLSLYYATLRIFEESDTSDDEVEPIEAKPRPSVVRTSSAREPKKKATTNGNGLPRAAPSATPSTLGTSDDLSPGSKRKRKARKKYLSEEIIASDGETVEEPEQDDAPTPVNEHATPTAPLITVNGLRKSLSRKPRKKPLSEETISPEDELDDPMALDGVATPSIASPLPVRSAPKAPAAVGPSEPPRKQQILKLSTRKTPKKKVISEETVLAEDKDNAAVVTPVSAPFMSTATHPNIDAILRSSAGLANELPDEDAESAADSPDPSNLSASAARRGLRKRRPAQKRPYYHDAQKFDDVEPDAETGDDSMIASPEVSSRRVSIQSMGKAYDDELLAHLDEDDRALMQDEMETEDLERRPKHFKGKGRAWKKEESDEDEEFTLAKKKAAKAAKAKAKKQDAAAAKKRGRPRKSGLSENVVRDDTDADTGNRSDEGLPGLSRSPSPPREPSDKTKKSRKVPRKSVKSAEIVGSDDEAEDTTINDSVLDASLAEVSTPKSTRVGKARKSDQSTASGVSPSAATTPKKSPTQSYTPKGTPKTTKLILSLVQAPRATEDAKENVEIAVDSAPVVVEQVEKVEKVTVEADMGVNVDVGADEELFTKYEAPFG